MFLLEILGFPREIKKCFNMSMLHNSIFPQFHFARYADDGLIHCKTKKEAEHALQLLQGRLADVKLEINNDKSSIVFCKKNGRNGDRSKTCFTFLGFQFRPRLARARDGSMFCTFSQAPCPKALKELRQRVRHFKIQFRVEQNIEDLSRSMNPAIRGWQNYYSSFGRTSLHSLWRSINYHLVKWIMRKYKKYKRRKGSAFQLLRRIAESNPKLFVHWQLTGRFG